MLKPLIITVALQKSLQSRKESKYSILPSDYLFQPVVFETAVHRTRLVTIFCVRSADIAVSGDPHETSFLFQHLSVLLRFNSVLISESFCSNDEDPDL